MTSLQTESNLSDTLNWWDDTKKKTETLARWIALYEAVNLTAEMAESKNISPDDIIYKPKPILRYINETQDIIIKKLLQVKYNIDVCYEDIPSEDYQVKVI